MNPKQGALNKKRGTPETKWYHGDGMRMSKGQVRRSRKADRRVREDLKTWREHAY